ncbi:hypothetical protein LCM08_06265 [Salipiger pacificus]|nr:hypothetical protein [Alloyangia pacifica]
MSEDQNAALTPAERQARARARWASRKLKRIEFKVPEEIAEEVKAMVRDRIARFEADER